MLTLAKHFQFQADNSLATKQLEGRKQNKELLTLALCCNGDGSDKLPLWIIGKYKNPCCLKNVNLCSLGCTYRSNAKAWMTQIIFLEWLKAFDLHVVNYKVLLVLDNCSAHVPLEELPARIQLRNTCLLYLPSNMTSKIQPCDAGIIRNFKAYYRRRFNRLLLQRLEDGVDQAEKIDVLQAIRLAIPVWATDVKSATIQNCYKHCQIRTTEGPGQATPTEKDLIDKDVIDELESQITRLGYKNPMDIWSLLTYWDEDNVSYIPMLDEIIDGHSPQPEGI